MNPQSRAELRAIFFFFSFIEKEEFTRIFYFPFTIVDRRFLEELSFFFSFLFSLFFREVREEIFDSFHSEGSFHHGRGGKQGNHGCPGNWYLRLSVDGRKCFIKVTVLKCSELGSLGEINILRFLGDGRYFMNVFLFFLLSLVLHTSFDLTPFIQVPEASAR